MKKLLGISIVAMLAVSPMVANAALTKESLDNTFVGDTTANHLATTTYVKGAYKATSARIDEVIDDITVATDGTHVKNANSVGVNLKALDTAITNLNSGAGSVASQIQSGAQNGTFTAANGSGISATDIKGAINELGADVGQNKSDIATIKASDAMTSGIDATKVAQIATNADDIAAINNAQTGILKQAKDYTDTLAAGAVADNTAAIEAINDTSTGILKQAKDYTDTLAAGAVATNTADIDTINNKVITFVQEWGGNPVTKKISQLPDFQ